MAYNFRITVENGEGLHRKGIVQLQRILYFVVTNFLRFLPDIFAVMQWSEFLTLSLCIF